MKILYLDCSMGAAGDMLAGALLELVPDPDAALAELNAFGIPGVKYGRETLAKCGIAATHLSVKVDGHEESSIAETTEDRPEFHHHHEHHHEHRSLADVLHVIGHLKLEPSVSEDVKSVYESLAAAESRAHGKAVGEIHFHEVGALDAIADIAAFCHLLRRVAPDKVVASPIHVGSGTVNCAHGVLPVPAPATAFLLEGMPSFSDGVIVGELCTPTGAALIRRFAVSFGPQPLMTVGAMGYGAGRKDFSRANVVRAMLGESVADESSSFAKATEDMGDGEIFELDFNVDDMTGEELAFAAERIFAAGARDVSFVPVVMKKGRPGQRVGVMCAAETRGEVVKAIFAHTTTLGVRETLCRRYTLERKVEMVALPDGSTVRRKVASGYGVCRAKWEADDLAAFARTRGIPLSEARAQLETLKGET